MHSKVTDVRQICIGSILLLTAVSSSAVTLGRHSGAAIIGRPLDIRVQALLSPGESIDNQCLSAEVLYGDIKVPAGLVRTTAQRTSPDAEPSVRVQSQTPIDEPIVTVFVRAGCTTPFTRRYVLLADPLSEPVRTAVSPGANPVRIDAPAAIAAPATQPVAGAAETIQPATARPSGSAPAPRASALPPSTRAPGPGIERPARRASAVRRPPTPTPDPVPRLELDALDLSLSIERDPVLKLSLSLLSEPTTSEETRAAAGLLWKAINASPEDVLREARKLEVLEAESRGLRESEVQNQARITQLSAEVDSLRAGQWLVYLLGLLLLVALSGLLWLWRRQKTASGKDATRDWWAAEAAIKAVVREPVPARAHTVATSIDLDLDLSDESGLSDLRPLSRSQGLTAGKVADAVSPPERRAPAAAGRRDFAPSQLPSRSVAAEELSDVQQQVDFFLSLGEDEQAIQVLRLHIQDSQVPSALGYLDLLKVFHRLGRRDEYEKLRAEFNQVFNAGAPPFEQYADGSRGLEAYETAFGRIQALWPEPRVLDVIEESIFREPGDPDAEVFDLEAYRELLLLRALAKEIIQGESAPAGEPRDFESTKVQRLQARSKTEPDFAMATKPMDMAPPASPNLGLDVNLDDLIAFTAFEASLPEASAPVTPTAKKPDFQRDESGNLIDFEVLDFTAPDVSETKNGPKSSNS